MWSLSRKWKKYVRWKPNPANRCFSRKIKQLEGTRQNLANVLFLWSFCFYDRCVVVQKEWLDGEGIQHQRIHIHMYPQSFGTMRERSFTSVRNRVRLSYCMKADMSYRVWSSTCCGPPLGAHPSSVCRNSSGLRGGGSGGDPLSVMGQGHTMGALCQICWGCTAVGRGVALIFVRMFTGVCHVWKLIRCLTFPSHNCRRIYISFLGKKKKIHWKWWKLQRTDWDFRGRNHTPVLLTTHADNIFVLAIVFPWYQR